MPTLPLRAFLLGCLVLLSALAPSAHAHEGPPFPVLVDQRVGTMLVSVWADPDIGTGTFFVVLEPDAGTSVPENLRIDIAVAPVSGRLAGASYRAEPQRVRHGARFFAEVPFDEGGLWNVRVTLNSAAGSHILTTRVEPTPDGTIGPFGLVLYLLPFLAVGFLWLKAVLYKRKLAAGQPR